MNTATKLGAYGAGLALVFGVAFAAGHLAGPFGSADADHSDRHAAVDMGAHDGNPDGDSDGDSDEGTAGGTGADGLEISARGYTLAPLTTAPVAGDTAPFRFRILGPDGAPVTRYTPTHDKELHLIVVRRDLSGFQHLHPDRDEAGTWQTPVRLPSAGDYRVFADFAPAGDRDGPLTLGTDLAVRGVYQPAPLPGPARTDTVDGYTVTLEGTMRAGTASGLVLTVKRDGAPVTDLEPYLGAYGHLVALRQGDLAYLHVHPEGEPGDGQTASGPDIAFHAEVPAVGTYRLYLDFKHGGRVHTAEFTVVASGPRPAPEHDPHEPGHGEEHGTPSPGGHDH